MEHFAFLTNNIEMKLFRKMQINFIVCNNEKINKTLNTWIILVYYGKFEYRNIPKKSIAFINIINIYCMCVCVYIHTQYSWCEKSESFYMRLLYKIK